MNQIGQEQECLACGVAFSKHGAGGSDKSIPGLCKGFQFVGQASGNWVTWGDEDARDAEQEAKAASGGVWNLTGTPVPGASRNGCYVTLNHQRLNAAEAVVDGICPPLGRLVRTTFDRLELVANAGETDSLWSPRRWLWESGPVLFSTMGWTSMVMLAVTGRLHTVSRQYVEA